MKQAMLKLEMEMRCGNAEIGEGLRAEVKALKVRGKAMERADVKFFDDIEGVLEVSTGIARKGWEEMYEEMYEEMRRSLGRIGGKREGKKVAGGSAGGEGKEVASAAGSGAGDGGEIGSGKGKGKEVVV